LKIANVVFYGSFEVGFVLALFCGV